MPDRSLNPRISRLRRAGVPRAFRGNCISSHRFANACLDSTVIMTKVRGMKRLDAFLVHPLPVANYCPQTTHFLLLSCTWVVLQNSADGSLNWIDSSLPLDSSSCTTAHVPCSCPRPRGL